jgi:peptide/nickel transport system substrate-binding protein
MPLVQDDGRALEIRLRGGLAFPDGTPVTAVAVKRSLEYMLDPRTQCPGGGPLATGYFDALVGLGDFVREVGVDDPVAADQAAERGITGIEAVNETALVLRLEASDPWLPHALAQPWAILRAPGSSRSAEGAAAGLLGPYRIVRYSPGAVLAVERESTWPANVGAGMPEARGENMIDGADLALGVPPATQLAQLRDEEIDLSLDGSAPAGPDARRLATDPDLRDRLFSTPADTLGYLVLRADRRPLSDPELRKAVNRAVDRRRLARLAGGPLVAEPWSQLVPSNLLAAEPPRVQRRDVRAARAIVRTAGEGRAVAVTVTSASDTTSSKIAASVARDLRRVGFAVARTELPPGVAPEYLLDPAAEYDIAVAVWGPAVIDAASILGPLLLCGRGANAGGFCTTNFDERYAEIATLPLGSSRSARFARLATDTALEEAPLAPLVQTRRISLISSRVGNYRWGPVELVQLTRVFLRLP